MLQIICLCFGLFSPGVRTPLWDRTLKVELPSAKVIMHISAQLESAKLRTKKFLAKRSNNFSSSVPRDALSGFSRCESKVNLWLLRTEPGWGRLEQDGEGGGACVSAFKDKSNNFRSPKSPVSIPTVFSSRNYLTEPDGHILRLQRLRAAQRAAGPAAVAAWLAEHRGSPPHAPRATLRRATIAAHRTAKET